MCILNVHSAQKSVSVSFTLLMAIFTVPTVSANMIVFRVEPHPPDTAQNGTKMKKEIIRSANKVNKEKYAARL